MEKNAAFIECICQRCDVNFDPSKFKTEYEPLTEKPSDSYGKDSAELFLFNTYTDVCACQINVRYIVLNKKDNVTERAVITIDKDYIPSEFKYGNYRFLSIEKYEDVCKLLTT